jgi:branched-chain amino acid transport system substrate-binding protein
MKLHKVSALAAVSILAFAACSSSGATTAPSAAASGGESAAPSVASKGTLKIGTELPMSGGEVANGVPTANGVKLAIKQINEKGGVGGYTIDINVQDDAVNGVHDPQQGAKNMTTLVADEAVIGVVGPFNSGVAKAEIPIGNEAGLMQCSPANTNDGVTLPPEGDKYRAANPTKLSYIRTATPDAIQGPAGASFTFNDLGAKSVYILDDTETFGVGVGDSFEAKFKELGGTVVKRDSAPKSTTDYTSLFTSVASSKPAAVYLAGTTPSGMGLALKQGRSVPGFETIPFVGPDGVADLGPGGTEGATITIAGAASHDVYGTVGALHDIPDPKAFSDAYTAEFGTAPGAYSAGAYACAQVLLQSLEKVINVGTATDMAGLREGVRANASDPANQFDTVLGKLSFSKYGDNLAPYISFYKVDLTAEGGKGGWVFVKQQAFDAIVP